LARSLFSVISLSTRFGVAPNGIICVRGLASSLSFA